MDSYAITQLPFPKKQKETDGTKSSSNLLQVLKRAVSRNNISPSPLTVEDLEAPDEVVIDDNTKVNENCFKITENGVNDGGNDTKITKNGVKISETKITIPDDTITKQPVVNTCSLTFKATFDFKLGLNFGDCDIGGIACVRDGKIVVLDRANQKLKLFDKAFRCITTCSVSNAQRLSAVSEHKVAVSSGTKVIFYHVKRSDLKCSDTIIRTEAKSFAIASTDMYVFVICRQPPDSACVKHYFREKGKVRSHWKLTFTMEHLFCQDLSINSAIAVDEEEATLYITDAKNKYLASTSFTGQLLRFVKFEWIPRGLAIVGDFLIVCNDSSGSLILMSKNGESVKTLVSNLHGNPGLLCFNKLAKELHLSTLFSKSIRVYSVDIYEKEDITSEC